MSLFGGITKAFSSAASSVGSALGSITGNGWLSAGSNLLGALGSYAGGQSANAASLASTREQMDFQERMRATQYQTAVEDLKKAGLNPMLAYSQGGAGTPSGSSYRAVDAATPAINTALQGKLNAATIDKLNADTAASESIATLNNAQAAKTAVDTRLSTANAGSAEIEFQKSQYLRDKFDSFFTAGKELDARKAKAIYESFASSRDWNTLHYLDEFAAKQGFRNFDTALSSTDFLRSLTRLKYDKFQLNEASALSDFYGSKFGHDFAPYMSSAKGMSDIGTSILGTGVNLFKPRSKFEFKGR
jgi:hypothetical protein